MAPGPLPPQLFFSGNPDEALIRWPCFSDIARRLRVRFENSGAPLSYAEAVETLMIVAPLLAVDERGSSHVVQLAAMAVVGDFHDGQFVFLLEKIGFVLGRWYGGLETLHSATASADAKKAVKKELFEAQAALQFVVQRVRTPDRDLLPIVRCRAALEQHSAANPFRRDDPRTLDCRNLFIFGSIRVSQRDLHRSGEQGKSLSGHGSAGSLGVTTPTQTADEVTHVRYQGYRKVAEAPQYSEDCRCPVRPRRCTDAGGETIQERGAMPAMRPTRSAVCAVVHEPASGETCRWRVERSHWATPRARSCAAPTVEPRRRSPGPRVTRGSAIASSTPCCACAR